MVLVFALGVEMALEPLFWGILIWGRSIPSDLNFHRYTSGPKKPILKYFSGKRLLRENTFLV